MRPLPAENVYLPFQPGPYRMSMDLTSAAESDWFEIDALYPAEMAERRRLLDHARGDVFGALPGSAAARDETLAMVATALTAHHPQWFSRDGHILHNQLTGEAWNLAAPLTDPLELAGRLVQEDLCLIQEGDEGPLFTAANLCFPSRWRLHDKLG
ncbi:MAG: heme-dependent oxidative N-demethylase subunit alpha family protein, partial [Rhodopila sp.]